MTKTELDELRMEAYYYGFDRTGVYAIDKVLSAVACAGKAYHHTSEWTDDTDDYRGHHGGSPVMWIENAAREAAESHRELVEALKMFVWPYQEHDRHTEAERKEIATKALARAGVE